ncbi:unnamed protein product, partial [Symbiodinium pilosum]
MILRVIRGDPNSDRFPCRHHENRTNPSSSQIHVSSLYLFIFVQRDPHKRSLHNNLLQFLACPVRASFFINSWAEDAVEASGLQTFGVPTRVASVDISMVSARWSFTDLEVASPPGYGPQNFMSMGSGVFDLGFRSMFFSPLVIQELTLSDVQVNIDQRVDGTSNAKLIMEHIHKVSDSAASKRFNEALMNKKVTVDKITFTNIVTRLCLHPSCDMSPPPYFVIKKVEVNDIGKKSGGVFVPDLFEII